MNDEELAEKLFLSLCVGASLGTSQDDPRVINMDVLNEEGYSEFRPTLHKIVNLCVSADTRKKRELLCKAYSWLGAKYRNEAIYNLNNFINIDLHIDEQNSYPLFVGGCEVLNMDRRPQICMITLYELATAYEGEYLFQLSLDVLNKAWELFPFCTATLAKRFNILRKMNRLDEIIAIIDYELTGEWTQPYIHKLNFGEEYYNDRNRRFLLVERDKYARLIQKKYIYKPRMRK